MAHHYVPIAHYESERARILYNTWRRITMELASTGDPVPWEWEQLDDKQRAAWEAVAGEPMDIELTQFVAN